MVDRSDVERVPDAQVERVPDADVERVPDADVERVPDADADVERVPDADVERVPDAHFERRYQREGDPWQLEHPWYERRKRAVTLACLGRERYRRAFEPACGPGLLTVLLAERCAALVAADPAASAVVAARRRLAAAPHVTVDRGAIPDHWPPGRFDLIVLSEVGYYLSPAALGTVVDKVRNCLDDDGELVAVHYRPPSAEHLLDGDGVHGRLAAAPGLRATVRHEEQRFVLDVFRPAR